MQFLVKNWWTLSAVWAGALANHLSWNKQALWKSLQKNSLKPNAASHNNSSWYTDTGGFLEHPPSWGSLYHKGPTIQKIILVFGGCPLIHPLHPYQASNSVFLCTGYFAIKPYSLEYPSLSFPKQFTWNLQKSFLQHFSSNPSADTIFSQFTFLVW